MSSLSTTTSIIQSQLAISFILSVKFPVVIRLTTVGVKTGEGLLLMAACKAPFTNWFLSFNWVLCAAAGGTMSNNNTGKPIPAK